MKKIVLFLVILLAVFFRFNRLNWDDNFHLHPDERFLTMAGGAISLPHSVLEYLDTSKSTFNPYNIGYKFFVYGSFPLVLNKIIAIIFNNDNYNNFTIQGRFLSAFFDLLIVILVYKTARLLMNKNSKLPLWAAFFYAIAVYPIQSSHFFTTDSFLVFFVFASFYFCLKSAYAKVIYNKILLISVSAIFFGLALASKISAIYIFPLIIIQLLYSSKNIKQLLVFTICYLLLAVITLRIADPKFFTPTFFENIKQLQALSVREAWYPPLVQWLNKKPVVFSLINLAVFGLGIPYFILVIFGMGSIILNLKFNISNLHLKSKNLLLIFILLWVIGFFLYQTSQLVQSIRYLYILFPFLAILAGLGMTKLEARIFECSKQFSNFKIFKFRFVSDFGFWISDLIVIVILLIWPLMFSSIYFHKHTRIEASEWIYKNLPNGSLVLAEEWDDGLPLGVKDTYGKLFRIESLPVFGADTPEKWQKMDELLGKADYYILSSNRAWGSIPTVPDRYPKMSKFYDNLLSGRTNYKKIKEFSSYPLLDLKIFDIKFQISLPDDWAEETFTVYDHPKVQILKNEK